MKAVIRCKFIALSANIEKTKNKQKNLEKSHISNLLTYLNALEKQEEIIKEKMG